MVSRKQIVKSKTMRGGKFFHIARLQGRRTVILRGFTEAELDAAIDAYLERVNGSNTRREAVRHR